MATINVKDAAGSTVAIEKPLTPGQAAMAASRPVVIASDQSAVPVSLSSVPSHAVTNAGTFQVQESGSALTALQLIDDTVVAQGTALGTTKNTLIGGSVTTSAPTYTTGQISPLSLDTSGALRVSGAGGGTQYTEDAAAAADPVGNMMVAVRRDTLSTTEVSADGDNIALKATNKGKLHVAAETRFGDTVADTGAGAVTSATQRVTHASDDPVTTSVQLLDDTITAQGTALGSTKTSLIGGSVTTAAPTYTTGQISPLSLDTSGALRVSGAGGGTQYTEDAAAAADPVGTMMMGVRRDTLSISEVSADGDNIAIKATNKGQMHVYSFIDPTSVNANGQNTMANSAPVVLASNQSYPTGMSPKAFSAAFTTLTRPANTTAYSAADSISNNATAASVTALSATVSDTNDDPITITEILVNSTDTGLAGKKLRAYLFNSDPTASTGVGAGDNAAYSQKKAGYIGSFMGYMETGFSDGTVGRLVPTYNETNFSPAGSFVVAKPTSGAKTLFIQYQAVEAFTPSANSTTIIGTAIGYQGRAV